MAKKLGLECKLYVGATVLTGGPPPAGMGGWSEVVVARDVTINLEAGEADVTARGNNGWRATRAALRDASLEFDIVWDSTDTELQALRDAYLGGSEISMAVMDGDIAVALSEGFCANFTITGFNRGEPLEEAVTVSVTAKPSGQHQWYEVP